MTPKAQAEGSTPGGRVRIVLILVILLLMGLLCGLLYVLRSVVASPERTPVLAEPPGVELVFQMHGGTFGQMKRPYDVAYDGEDTIYVTEPDAGRVLAFDENGENGRVFVASDLKAGDERSLSEFDVRVPMAVDVDVEGDVYVADRLKAAVVVFSADGEKLREIPVMSPKWVEVVGDRVYILSDIGTLFVTDLQGTALGQWGTPGREPDQLADPVAVTADDEGTIYIADMDNYRLLALSADLERQWQYGKAALTPEEQNQRLLAAPTGLTLGADGNIYLIDGLNSQIHVFSTEGKPVSVPLGEHGMKDDQFFYPVGIEWMADDLFVMADRFNDRVVGIRLTPVLPQEEE